MVETRISKLQNQEAKSTKTVRRHNTETRRNEINGRKTPEISKFSHRKTLKASSTPTTNNCNHSKLIQEIKRLIF